MRKEKEMTEHDTVTKRRYLATATFHLKIAKAFGAVGKTTDARAARRAARLCKKNA